MSLKYAYCPFKGDDDLVRMTVATIAAHNGVHKVDTFNDQMLFPGMNLNVVYRFQQLYIFAHGRPGAESVFDTAGSPLTVRELAANLRRDGLTLSIGTVKLWVCSGGMRTESSQATGFFFKIAMREEKFSNVKVFAYTFDLLTRLTHDKHKAATSKVEGQVLTDGRRGLGGRDYDQKARDVRLQF